MRERIREEKVNTVEFIENFVKKLKNLSATERSIAALLF